MDFHGVDCNCLCVRPAFGEARIAFEALEDPSDGYRSYLGEVRETPVDGHVFFGQPIARVVVQEDHEYAGFKLVDAETGHAWLRVGTDNYDDYYPCFKFEYDPPRST